TGPSAPRNRGPARLPARRLPIGRLKYPQPAPLRTSSPSEPRGVVPLKSVGSTGVEPACCCQRQPLKLVCLPIPPRARDFRAERVSIAFRTPPATKPALTTNGPASRVNGGQLTSRPG